jgi:hypothetical protein
MSSSYEATYYKIAALDELKIGQPRVYRAAGADIILYRNPEGVTAIDDDSRVALPVRIENGVIWVCLDACRQ